MRLSLLATILLVAAPAFAADQPSPALQAFLKLAETNGFAFARPDGYREVAPVRNRDMLYDYALVDSKKKVELRFALRPLSKKELDAYEEWKINRPKGTILTDPNQGYMTSFLAVALNVGQLGAIPPQQHFPPDAVKREFGADDGLLTTLVGPKSQFSRGYKQILVFVIHKRDVGEGYVFVLFDDPADFSSLPPNAFHALRFAGTPL